MANTDSAETKKLTASTTSSKVDFDKLVTSVYVKTDANVYIAFDRAATTSDFLLEAADRVVELEVACTEVHAITGTGTANLYFIGRR